MGGLVRRNLGQDFVQQLALDGLKPLLGHLQQARLARRAGQPSIGIVAKRTVRNFGFMTEAIGKPIQFFKC
jgi:hypothetical protein